MRRSFITSLAVLCVSALGTAMAQSPGNEQGTTPSSPHASGQSGSNSPANDAATSNSGASPTSSNGRQASYPPQKTVDHAVVAVSKMKADSHVADLLGRAQGILIVPHYVKVAAIVGGGGGSGVLLTRTNGQWSNPAFYNVGGGSIGAQLGGESGTLALILMNQKAVNAFAQHESNWTLTGDLGLTVVNYSATARQGIGDGDIVVWTDTQGLYGGAAVGVRDIRADKEADRAYYGQQQLTTAQILSGQVPNPRDMNAALLKDSLALKVAVAK